MSSRRLLFVVLLLALFSIANSVFAGIQSYTDSGKIDFDTAYTFLKTYGTWSQEKDGWTFHPNANFVPFASGRWIYSSYGWYWKGNAPHSWLTEHYGSWKHLSRGEWEWLPGGVWESDPVEIRGTDEAIGWRSAALDANGDYVEAQADRYSKPEEWMFVTLQQFINPITPKTIAPPEKAAQYLEDSSPSAHLFFTYRPLPRPGPHPADLVKYPSDELWLPPLTLQDKLDMQRLASLPHLTPLPTPKPKKFDPTAPQPNLRPDPALASSVANPDLNASQTNSVPLTPVNRRSGGAAGPVDLSNALASPNPDLQQDQTIDRRRVKYWVVMCLPELNAPIPADATPDQIYIFKPQFYQDDDGIQRRISIIVHPDQRSDAAERIEQALGGGSIENLTPSQSPRSSKITPTPVPPMPALPQAHVPVPQIPKTATPTATPLPQVMESPSPASTEPPVPTPFRTK